MIPLNDKSKTKPLKQRTLMEPPEKRVFKVALVGDLPEAGRYWIKQINRFSNFTCSSACTTGEEALLTFPGKQPDVVLLEIVLPTLSGTECIALIKKRFPNIRVVIFTAVNDPELVFRALEAGADGYLLKRTKPRDLRLALQEVLKDGVPMTSQIARCVIESFRRKANITEVFNCLSLREKWILMLMSKGDTNRVIAAKLNLSINTVCDHLKCVFKKLQVRSRTEAVIRYIHSQACQPEPEKLRYIPIKTTQSSDVCRIQGC